MEAKYNLGFVSAAHYEDIPHERFEYEQYITTKVQSRMPCKQTFPFYPDVWNFMRKASARKSVHDLDSMSVGPYWHVCSLPNVTYAWFGDMESTSVVLWVSTAASCDSTVVESPIDWITATGESDIRDQVVLAESFCTSCGEVDCIVDVAYASTCLSCGLVSRADNFFRGRQHRQFEGEEDRSHCSDYTDDPVTEGFDKQRKEVYSIIYNFTDPRGKVHLVHRYAAVAKRLFDNYRNREDRIHYMQIVVSACIVYGYWSQKCSPYINDVKFHLIDNDRVATPRLAAFSAREFWSHASSRLPISCATNMLSYVPTVCSECKRAKEVADEPHSVSVRDTHGVTMSRKLVTQEKRKKRGLNTHLPIDHPLWNTSHPLSVKKLKSGAIQTSFPTPKPKPTEPAVQTESLQPHAVSPLFEEVIHAMTNRLMNPEEQRIIQYIMANEFLPAHIRFVQQQNDLAVANTIELCQRRVIMRSSEKRTFNILCQRCEITKCKVACSYFVRPTERQLVDTWNRMLADASSIYDFDTVMQSPDVAHVHAAVLRLVHTKLRVTMKSVHDQMSILYEFMSNLYHESVYNIESIDPQTHVISFEEGRTSPFATLMVPSPWRIFADRQSQIVAFVDMESYRTSWQPPPSFKWPPIPVGWCMVVVEPGWLGFKSLKSTHTNRMYPSTTLRGHAYIHNYPRLKVPHVIVDDAPMVATTATLDDVCAGYPFYEPPAELDPLQRIQNAHTASVLELRTVTAESTVTIRRHSMYKRFWFGEYMLWKHQLQALHTIVNSTLSPVETLVSSGIAIVPCGGGKTLIGISIMGTVGARYSMVVCNNGVSCEQWQRSIITNTSLDETGVTILTSLSQQVDPRTRIVVTSYSSLLNHEFITHVDWGIIILDEVHMVGASSLRRFFGFTNTSLCSIVGLTATPLREDNHFKELHHIIGPFLYRAQWNDLVKSGIVATLSCVDVRCKMQFSKEYANSNSEIERKFYSALNPSKMKLCASLLQHHLTLGHQVLIFFEELFVMTTYAMMLKDEKGFPLVKIESKESHSIVSKALEDFRKGDISVLCFSRTGDSSFDIPNASVGIQVSSHNGSRRQEVQRMGRISRSTHIGVTPSPGQIDSYFYTLTSNNTREVEDRAHRIQYMAEDEFNFEHVSINDQTLDPKWSSIRIGMKQKNLTNQLVNKNRISAMIKTELQLMNQTL